jgi:ABC-type dipeptide/oligopeptide/nickel transport system ATPase subunit
MNAMIHKFEEAGGIWKFGYFFSNNDSSTVTHGMDIAAIVHDNKIFLLVDVEGTLSIQNRDNEVSVQKLVTIMALIVQKIVYVSVNEDTRIFNSIVTMATHIESSLESGVKSHSLDDLIIVINRCGVRKSKRKPDQIPNSLKAHTKSFAGVFESIKSAFVSNAKDKRWAEDYKEDLEKLYQMISANTNTHPFPITGKSFLEYTNDVVKIVNENTKINIFYQKKQEEIERQKKEQDEIKRKKEEEDKIKRKKEDEIDMEMITETIKISQLDDVVNKLSNGLNSNVGERGSKFSGGEKQRIGIARALYNKPKILVLDEATSSLDLETEKNFINSIYELKDDKTILIISHRESTLQNCDIVYEISQGKLNLKRKK